MNQAYIQAKTEYDNGYYTSKLVEGQEYQDFVMYELYKRGIVALCFSSKKYQYAIGENIVGAEIKFQKRYKEFGSFAIETEEKSHPSNPNYIPSGINRNDNSWLFITGDYESFYIFSTKYLRMLSTRYKPYEKPTSKGFVLPVEEAEKYCLRKIEVTNG